MRVSARKEMGYGRTVYTRWVVPTPARWIRRQAKASGRARRCACLDPYTAQMLKRNAPRIFLHLADDDVDYFMGKRL